MDFDLTESQKILQKTAGDFTADVLEPISAKLDRDARLPDDLISKYARIGLLGMTIPGKDGKGANILDCALVIEQIAYSGTGAWWLVALNNSIPEVLIKFGSEKIKNQYLTPLTDGRAYASIQFTEEETGSDPEALITKALPEGDYYLINGMKRFSTFGARKGYAVLYAKDEKGECTAFIIEKNQKGYSIEKNWDLMGAGGIEAVDIYFENMKVHKDNILGEKGKGFEILLHWIALEKIPQCSASVGIAQAALDESVKYVKNRKSRGKPVSSMQGIRWELADMKSRLEAARYMTYRAAFLYDSKHKDWINEAANAKLFVTPSMLEITESARQMHGGYGYTREFKIERLFRAAAGASAIATGLEINRSIVGAWLVQ